MSKLTLSVDERVVSRAKRYAKRQGTSLSAMVEAYLEAVSGEEREPAGETPVLRSLRGSLKRGDVREYKKHLAEKYR
jgi:hypothetical protein